MASSTSASYESNIRPYVFIYTPLLEILIHESYKVVFSMLD